MSRYPPGGALPPLQWGGDPTGRISSRSSRIHNSGRRSAAAEHNDHSPHELAQRSMQLKEDILSGGGVWQEKHSRELLQDHIHTITLAVKKLSAEIETIETQLHSSELASQYTTNSMKSLELQHVGTVNDLRSRVGRCDASIAKLSSDMRQLIESVAFFNQQLMESNSLFTKATTDLNTKIQKLETHMKRQEKDGRTKQESTQKESKQALTQLNDKTRAHLSELQKTVNNMPGECEYKILQERLINQRANEEIISNQKLEELEKRLAKTVDSLERRLDQIETSFTTQVEFINKSQQELLDYLEAKIYQRLDKSEASQRQDLKESNKRSDHALAILQESLETMRAVLEGKQKLLEEGLRNEMGKMKKTSCNVPTTTNEVTSEDAENHLSSPLACVTEDLPPPTPKKRARKSTTDAFETSVLALLQSSKQNQDLQPTANWTRLLILGST